MCPIGPFGINGGNRLLGGVEASSALQSRTATRARTTSSLSLRPAAPGTGSWLSSAGEGVRQAAAAFVAALGKYSSHLTPVMTTRVTTRDAVSAGVSGAGARVAPVMSYTTTLGGTRAINTGGSAERTSAAPLMLNLAGAASRLYSDNLHLDLNSPGAASRLRSSADLGLNLTSPEAASWLRSAAALGLDLSSPDAASVLSSALALGLDVTSPESASQLVSSALGLDLTSPDSASVLSSLSLGLDVTSPETASSLRSSGTIGLDVTSAERASTIQSTGELNSDQTSYGSSTLIFSGGGTPTTSVGSLTGTYTGVGTAAAATSLTVILKNNVSSLTSLTATTVKFEVRDQSNTLLFSFNGSIKAGDKVYLGANIGLSLSFSAGTLTGNQTAATTVSHTNSDVNPNAVFNDANANQRPRFDNNAQVTAGAFTVNGVSIAVNANDSVNSVLARITASAAGVTASFANDKVTLTSKTNSEDAIALAGDTSGFLNAVKLSGATTSLGNVRDDQQVLKKTAAFAGVSTGSFTINGVSIAVNRDTDTLASLLGRINGSAAGVTAAYDATQDKILLTGTANSEDLISVSGATGFLTAAKLATGNTVRGNLRDDRQVLAKTSQFAGVTSGNFSINGKSIAVNAATDTLQSLITKINGAGAGVTAAYDATRDRLVLTGTANGPELITVGNDASGFLAAARLDTANTVRGHLAEDTVALRDLSRFGSVVNGAFTIGGKTITVSTTDSVQSIVSRINDAGAGVQAVFDPTVNRLRLATDDPSEDVVAVGGDTSGFLAAAGLDAADTIRGNIRDDRQVLARTTRFGGVTSGTFRVNGRSIAVDSATDTLDTVIARINAAAAGVSAAYDPSADRVVLTGTSNSEDLITVDGDSTGFLAAAGLATGNTVRGHLREDGVALKNLAGFQGVTSGSFRVDGQVIAVDTDTDTITSIIDRINASGARVTAAYDGDLDRITLQATYDSEDDVPVDADTSGFLAAAHLFPADSVRGNIRDDKQVLARTAAFGTVTDGSFRINGREIAVEAGRDTIETMIDRINGADAGVVATYDPLTDRIELATTGDSEDAIDVGGDTSGFLAAAHLAAGNTVRGNVRDDLQVLSKTPQFGAVRTGAFTLNGKVIEVDASADSMAALIDRINQADAGVTASFDTETGRLALVGTADGEGLIDIGDDATGLLAAAGVDPANTERGNLADDRQAMAATGRFGAVTGGSFTVNGRLIVVDPDQDSLQAVIDRVNAADAGATAVYDPIQDRVTFAPAAAGGPLRLESDSSGLLEAVGITPGSSRQTVNADAAFNDADGPQFDPGLRVHAGSFRVNGVTIDVADDDSVNAVLARITASEAGVTAALDPATQMVTLTSKPGQSLSAITVGDDDSGFLAAVKLDDALSGGTTARSTSAHDIAFAALPEYAGVRAGAVTINGSSVSVDPAVSTVRGLLAAVNRLPDVTASVDDRTGRVRIASTRPGGSIELADSSGVLAALGITAGAYAGTPAVTRSESLATGVTTVSNALEVTTGVSRAVAQLNAALAGLPNDADRARLEAVLRGAMTALGDAGAQGLSVESDSSGLRIALDAGRLERGLGALEGHRKGPGEAIDKVLTSLTHELDGMVATPARAPLPAAGFAAATGDQALARLKADRAAASLLVLGPSLRVQKPDAATLSEAAAAYADKDTFFAPLRTQLLAQTAAADAGIIRNLLEAQKAPDRATAKRATTAYGADDDRDHQGGFGKTSLFDPDTHRIGGGPNLTDPVRTVGAAAAVPNPVAPPADLRSSR